MKKRISHTLSALVLSLTVLTQIALGQTPTDIPNVIPPSPEAASLFKFLDYPVGNATGVPDISVPLYEVHSGSLTMPVSISYHAGGRKVYDQTGPVGLGWNLNAGGMISRTVYGKPDDQTQFLGSSKKAANINQQDYYDFDFLKDAVDSYSRSDTEYDIFSYSCGGYSGKFVMDQSNNTKAVLMPLKPLLIQGGGFPNQIIDEKGIEYDFNVNELFQGSNVNYNGFFQTLSGKLLTQVISANKKDTILLKYVQFNNKTDAHYTADFVLQDNDNRIGQGTTGPARAQYNEYSNAHEYTIQRLTEIDFKEGKVLFQLQDGTDQYQSIKIFNKKGQLIRKINLVMSYLDLPAFTGMLHNYKLDALQFADANNTAVNQYNFEYQPSSDFDAHNRDYWGYLNSNASLGQGNTRFVPTYLGIPIYVGSGGGTGSTYDFRGGNRSANFPLAGMIKKITYPTGGATEFSFEQNLYFYNGTANAGPGLRVAQIKTTDPNGSVTYKTYKYGSNENGYGDLNSYNVIIPSVGMQYMANEKRYITSTANSGQPYVGYRTRVYSSEFLPEISEVANEPIFYSTVTQYDGTLDANVGKTVFYYGGMTYYGTFHHLAQLPLPAYPPAHSIYSFGDWAIDYSLAKPHIDEFNYWRGVQLQHQDSYKNNGGNNYSILKSTSYTYKNTPTDTLKGLHVFQYIDNINSSSNSSSGNVTVDLKYAASSTVGLPVFQYADYKIITGKTELVSQTEAVFENGGTVAATTAYTYNPQLLNNQTTVTDSKGHAMVSNLKYPFDNLSDGANTSLNNRHMLNYVVEQNELNNSAPVKSFKTQYKDWGNDVVEPEVVYAKVGSNNYEQRVKYLFDQSGKARTVSKTAGPPLSYIYGYNKQYPVAQVTNAQVNEIYYDNLEDGTDFPVGPVIQDRFKAHTGSYSGRIDNSNSSEVVYHSNTWLQVQNSAAKKYHYSGWVYSNGPSVDLFLFMKRAGEGGYYSYVDNAYTGETGKWVYLSKDFLVPADVTQLNLRVDNNGSTNGQSQSIWFDDLRIYPSDAQMVNYTYEPLLGVTSQTDTKGETAYYEYDAFQRLYKVKDSNGNIIKQYCYNYAGQQTDCSVPVVNPVTNTSAVYARVEVRNVTYVNTSSDPNQQVGNQDEHADVYVRFYSDAACTTPYVLPADMDVDMQQLYNYSNQNGSGQDTYVGTYTALAGNGEVYLGNLIMSSSSSYDDPYYGYVTSYYNFIYTLVTHTGSNYMPEDTYGFY